MSEPGREIRLALRWLLRKRQVSLLAVVTIAVGIGPCTAVFSIVNGVVLRSLPFQEPERLVSLWSCTAGRSQPDRLSPAEIYDLGERCRSFSALGAYRSSGEVIGSGSDTEVVERAAVTTGLLPILGVQPVLGRGFSEEDLQDGAENVVIISHGLWQRRLGGDPGVIGSTLTEGRTIIGVLPEHFPPLPAVGGNKRLQVLLPFEVTAGNSRTVRSWHAIARLRPGIGNARAQAELEAVTRQLAHEYPDSNRGLQFLQVPITEQILGDLDTGLLLLLGAVVFVVLIASSNVANLLLAVGVGRRRELAIRLALGASQAALARRLLLEGLLLGLTGGALGVLLGWWGLRLLPALAPANIPRLDEVAIDGRVLLFGLAMTLLAGLIPGLVSLLQHRRTPLRAVVEDRSVSVAPRGGGRLAQLLVVAQTALATMLLIAAGLMLRSCAALLSVDPGFAAEQLLTVTLRVPDEIPSDVAFTQVLQETLGALPAVTSVATVAWLPFSSAYYELPMATDVTTSMPVSGEPAYASIQAVSPGYFSTMRIPLLEGRDFTLAELAAGKHSGVVIVSETAAAEGWPGRDSALGGILYWEEEIRLRVVGVAGDTRHASLSAPKLPAVYLPVIRRGFWLYVVIRTSRDPHDLIEPVRAAVLGLDSRPALLDIAPMRDLVLATAAGPRLLCRLLAVMSALATALALVGIYGGMPRQPTTASNHPCRPYRPTSRPARRVGLFFRRKVPPEECLYKKSRADERE